ncbi:hypothetical protein RHGRI_005629 [Rhododendron griersonianum]|uniref:Uncharacterized protein n=1 Tax=Rhododendron griersonianum TaxID=479676 RepID=A0AAV6LDX4_9ERIC|nr:hypothetical protein RHGRI_005629 [Rhododendron griersonianum]
MYVSPGFLSQQLTGYEKSRNRNVEENLQVLESFGIKSLSKALFGSNHSGNTKGTHKRKNKAGHGNIDEDYLPSNGEGRVSSSEEDDDSSDDDVSSGSQASKVTSTGQGKKNGPGKKKGTSDAQPLRKSQRTQENGCQALQIQPHTVLAEGMTEVAAQPTQLPTSPTEQTNPFGSPHTIASSTELLEMKIKFQIKENHKKQPFAEHFKETHIRHRLGKDVWINDKAKEAHQEIVRITSDVTNPQTEEHASVEVLGKRSGYLKGYGIRKNTKANAMPSQPIPNPEVVALQEKLANHEKVVANHEKAMADQAKMFQHMLMMVVMKSGIDPACIPGLVSCSGNEEDDTLAGEEDDEFFADMNNAFGKLFPDFISYVATYSSASYVDMAAEICLTQLPTLLEDPNADFQPSPFFTKQLTAFEVWLDHGSEHKKPPEQLPIVLQVLLSQCHRFRALVLLGRFLDMGWDDSSIWALSVGIFPYVLKLLQTTTPELRQILVFIWTKILAFDKVHI